MDELMVTTRLDRAAMERRRGSGSEVAALAAAPTAVFGLVPLDGADGALPAVAVVSRSNDEARLLALVTHPEVQGRGYGSMLLDGLVDDLRTDGCARLLVDAGTDADADRWLLDRGFARVSVTELALDL